MTFLKDVSIKIMYDNEFDRNYPPDRNTALVLYRNIIFKDSLLSQPMYLNGSNRE